MKNLIMRLYATVKQFTITDFAFFKIVLIAIGILFGVYFNNFFTTWVNGVWVLAAVAYLYMMVKIIRYMLSSPK